MAPSVCTVEASVTKAGAALKKWIYAKERPSSRNCAFKFTQLDSSRTPLTPVTLHARCFQFRPVLFIKNTAALGYC